MDWSRVKKGLFKLFPYMVVVLFITGSWFLKSGYLFFVDFVMGPVVELDWQSPGFFINLIIKFFSFFLPISFIQKIFVSLILFVVILGAKKMVEQFVTNKWLVFVLSLFAIFNPFVYDRLSYGQVGIIAGFGFLLWGFGFLLEYLKDRKIKNFIWVGILFGLAILFVLHFIFFILLIAVFFLAISFWQKKKMTLKEYMIGAGVVAGIILLINVNWLAANIFTESHFIDFIDTAISHQDLTVFQTRGETGGEVVHNIALMSGFWGKDQYRYIDLTTVSENWGRSFYFLLPLLVWGIIAGLQKRKSRPLVIGLLIMLGISFVLAIGIRFGGARETTFWLFDNFPFYKGMREPQKWVAMVVLVYIIFLSIGANQLFQKSVAKKNSAMIKIILMIVIIMQAPLLLFGLRGQIKPVDYPPDWYAINEFIVQESNCEEKILFLPWHMYMGFKFIGRVSINPAKIFFTCPVISGTNIESGDIYDNSQTLEGELVPNWIFSHGETDLLKRDDFNIHYVVLAKETDDWNYTWLKDLNDLELITETNNLILYEVK